MSGFRKSKTRRLLTCGYEELPEDLDAGKTMTRSRFVALILFVVVLLQVAVTEARVAIDRKPSTVVHKTFDPANKPADLPKLHPGEVAVCVGEFGIGVRLTF